jgi:zinc D-Ala-D-Ala dipeptidase
MNKVALYLIFSIYAIVISCNKSSNNTMQVINNTIDSSQKKALDSSKPSTIKKLSDFEKYLIENALVDVTDIDSSFIIDIKYSGTDNFLGIDLYGDFNRCYLNIEVARMLANAHKNLKDSFPDLRFIIYDGLRPQSVQKVMWDNIKVPEHEKQKYLSKPEYGSLHNFGAAVDLSLADKEGNLLDMGTEYDSFDELAYPINEKIFLRTGKLSEAQVANRRLLRKVMEDAGFFNIQTEWWHFNACYRKEARKKYAFIESFDLKHNTPTIHADTNKTDIAETNIKISFRVQLLATKQKIKTTDARFLGLEVERYYHNGLYKYTTGEFDNITNAFEYRDKVLSNGIEQAFVAAFKNGKRIEIKEAIDLLN